MSGTVLVGVYVFVLAMFVGFEVITKVPPTLHTPLMSGSNAISGISIVGALVVAGSLHSPLMTWIGVIAVVLATINVVGGFVVTDRMLQMFHREPAGRLDARAESVPGDGSAGSGIESVESGAPTTEGMS